MAAMTGQLDSGREFPTESPQTLPRRTRIACKACNARRVKCDAVNGQPCWHCRTRGTTCELIQSRRGKYLRKKRNTDTTSRSQEAETTLPLEKTTLCDDPTPTAIHDDHYDNRQFPFGITESVAQPYSSARPPGPSLVVEFNAPKNQGNGSVVPLTVYFPVPATVLNQRPLNDGPQLQFPLSLQEALELPAKPITDQVINVFFETIFPAFPVLDRSSFTRLYTQGQVSPLILQCILLVGFTVASEDVVHAAGYETRECARKSHYLRAKALYDMDYDRDRMNIVAALLLLGFWWESPEDQKDTCYWVGCAMLVAQSLGLHRSTINLPISPEAKALRKRIWWSVYIRDRHTAAAFGRPYRIRDEDCDVEPLTREDLISDIDYDHGLLPAQQDVHISYVLEMSKLATILGDILSAQYSPHLATHSELSSGDLASELYDWETRLPEILRRTQPDGSLNAPFWASMLHFNYHYCQILLFRSKSSHDLCPAESQQHVHARRAADSITRLAEDILSAGMIQSTQIHLVPALFGALSIHTIVICGKDSLHRQMARNKSRQCLLALNELAKHWPVKIWVARAFMNLLKRLIGQNSTDRTAVNVSISVPNANGDLSPSSIPDPRGLVHAVPQDENDSRTGIVSNTQSIYVDGSELQDLYAPDFALHQDGNYDSLLADFVNSTHDNDQLLQSLMELPLSIPPENLS